MEEFNWDLFESDHESFRLEQEENMIRSAYENTFLILTGKATWNTLLEKQSQQPGSIDQHNNTAILFNPFTDDYSPKFPHLHNEVDRNELIDTMIDYYTDTEEYEKCAELVKIKNKSYEQSAKDRKAFAAKKQNKNAPKESATGRYKVYTTLSFLCKTRDACMTKLAEVRSKYDIANGKDINKSKTYNKELYNISFVN